MKSMKDTALDSFQYTVSELLIRNKSILDGMTKLGIQFQDQQDHLKAVTQCGCVGSTLKTGYPEDMEFDDINKVLIPMSKAVFAARAAISLEGHRQASFISHPYATPWI